MKIGFVLANSADADEMPHYASFHLGLHCLPKFPLRGYGLQRVKTNEMHPLSDVHRCVRVERKVFPYDHRLHLLSSFVMPIVTQGKVFCLCGLRFYVPVNSYGHVETVSSPNHTFSLGKLD